MIKNVVNNIIENTKFQKLIFLSYLIHLNYSSRKTSRPYDYIKPAIFFIFM